MKILIEQLGNTNTERFISVLLREPFDYTEWRRENIFIDMTVEEISKESMKIYRQDNLRRE